MIKKFIEASYLVKTAITEQNLTNAKKNYEELYSIYRQINDSKLDQVHKEVAYQQLLGAYHATSDLKQQITAPTNIIAIALVIVILSVIIFINPRMVGLAVFQEKTTQLLNLEFTQSKSQQVELKSIPTSLSVSGQFRGAGTAKLFAEIEGRRLLIFDSTKTKITAEKFQQVCIDTCVMPRVSTTKLVLFAETNNAAITINSVEYYSATKNNPPIWNQEPQIITLKDTTTIDFSQYFKDIDGDELVYLATTPQGLSAEISGSIVKFSTDGSIQGQKQIELLVSDMKQTTKARINVDVVQ